MAGELITMDGQLEWRGTLLGSATSFRLIDLTGWYDLPTQRGQNVSFSGRHGGYPGQKLSDSRVITATLRARTTLAGFPAAVEQLRQITAPDENPVEEPFVGRLQGLPLRAMARCVRRAIPTDVEFANGHTTVQLQWEATDPRLYSVGETVYTASLATPGSSGLDFGSGGLDFGSGGLDFGTGQQGGVITATNAGHVPMWPIIEIDGPVLGPGVIFPDGRRLLFDGSWQVLAGQTIVLDTALRTAEIAGVSVAQRLPVRQWTPLQPGDTKILFTAAAYDAAARMRVRVRNAYQ